jgi:superoxide dismutase, Fe-Mn family
MANNVYKAKKFNLSGLEGISDKTLEMHFGLYEGYVKNTNLLTEQLLEMSRNKKASPTNPSFTEIKRHLGFEFGGMVLHEYYFGNLAPKGKGNPSNELKRALEESFGGFDAWKADFVATGGMRGVGWSVLYQDPVTGKLSNNWIELHDVGVPSGFKPVLVMDVWEHAFLLDYKPSERSKYIEAFCANINWDAANEWFKSNAAVRPAA